MEHLKDAGQIINVVLLSLILWFIKRLLTKVDKIDVLEIQVKALVHEMRALGQLRERVAVLEAFIPAVRLRKAKNRNDEG